jgi:prephenate dehydrogenase
MKITIVGTGMIGGAVARAARLLPGVTAIVGVDSNAAHAASARALGLVDTCIDEVPADADLVVIATPNEAIPDWVIRLQNHAGVVMDVGSVKRHVLDTVRASLGRLPPRFVPCHPLAGSEKHGPEHAPADLFRDRLVILTPDKETSPEAVDLAARFWRDLGALLHVMDSASHDDRLAVTSHLPHLLAFAFMASIGDDDLRFSGGGFRDFSRIAASSPELWWAIFKLNQAPLTAALDRFDAEIASLRRALLSGRDDEGLRVLSEAATRRRKIP